MAELIGFGTVERSAVVRPGETTQVEISMDASAIAIDEIVVTGTPSATSRREIGNAIFQVNAAAVVEAAPVSNVNELLNARTSGALVASQSGNLGAGAPIRLRGDNSLSLSGQPIVYVDGIRVDANADDGGIFGHTGTSRLQDINPDDIESVEILKGPAAATLYGTEASNGVIQIITKKGRPGDTRVNLSIEQGANWFRDAVERVPDNCDRDGSGQLICQNLIADERALGNQVFRTGHHQSYSLSVRGGQGDIGYFLSGKLEDQEGIYLDNGIERKSFRGNVNTTLWNELDLGVNLGYVTSSNPRHPEGFSNDQGIIANLLFATPLQRDTPLRGWFRATPEESYEIDT
ncbi:MAG: TonB-dependent receptor plug domain-containing protein, partial [Gemmatimonadetes bacterium]|nr:TonB-dependent receptor plug domain-containing protein [Gemmatimonadota bacterium]NIT86367.1 TonB-dependent receptor plug domain-containing protein [Gemmatimonadota bacterium]NIU30204.1 TonB-dependent receptor plug domain-containing protein [Gemmatimonadota bacterium]NIU35121.1 TonB-dependent receptor plug domain-containing protein [Gemmatimonadota bacterium]NIV60599.1 TonB-dependent receptor plug domain-containing protein [Gemmatimonadota bacterium]